MPSRSMKVWIRMDVGSGDVCRAPPPHNLERPACANPPPLISHPHPQHDTCTTHHPYLPAAWRSGALTIGDLKNRIAALMGVRPEKQKLLFKGVLGDATVPLAATQLRDGSKVLMGGGSK